MSVPDKRLSSQVRYSQRSSGSFNSTEILASIVQAVAVLVVNLRPIRTEVFVHLNLRTVNPCNRVGRPLSILILRTSDVSLLYENLFGIPGIRERFRLDALER